MREIWASKQKGLETEVSTVKVWQKFEIIQTVQMLNTDHGQNMAL